MDRPRWQPLDGSPAGGSVLEQQLTRRLRRAARRGPVVEELAARAEKSSLTGLRVLVPESSWVVEFDAAGVETASAREDQAAA